MLATDVALKMEAGAGRANAGVETILFHVHEDGGFQQRLQAALAVARACSAHLRLLHVVPVEAYTFVDSYGGTNVSAQLVQSLEEQAKELRTSIEARLRTEDVSWDYECVTSALTAELLGQAALADLVVCGREPRVRDLGFTGFDLINRLLADSRTPLLIPGDQVPIVDVSGRAVIAWNGSNEAANAVRYAIGLLKLASDVSVVRFIEKPTTGFPSTRLLEYLSRHGIHAQLEERPASGDSAADLVAYAKVRDASYLVMGGYSHSRAGEFLFGGVTRDLLRACPITLVVAH